MQDKKMMMTPKIHVNTFNRAGIDFAANKYTILVYFRGSWCGSCRAELRELEAGYKDLKAQGAEVHAITAEPGGEAAVRARLAKNNVPTLSFGVHSDEMHKLIADPYDFYSMVDVPATFFKEDYKNYTCINPALLVCDNMGMVVNYWSWKSSGFEPGWVYKDVEMDKLSKFGVVDQILHMCAMGMPIVKDPTTGCTAPLTKLRPVVEDILPATMEKRAVKLHEVTLLPTDKKVPAFAKIYVNFKLFWYNLFLMICVLLTKPKEATFKLIGKHFTNGQWV